MKNYDFFTAKNTLPKNKKGGLGGKAPWQERKALQGVNASFQSMSQPILTCLNPSEQVKNQCEPNKSDFYIKQDAIIEQEWYNGKILFEL